MRKVTTINLNGRAYQLEEQAYDKLQVYLRHAETTLGKNPDKTEVLADIEQAIADKCDRLLKDGKNVVTTEQIAEILGQMGEVESDDTDSSEAASSEPASAKRLFVIREGAMFMGVCNGIGAYLGIEPNLVRLAFILLTIFTGGFWIVVYVLLGLFLPTAKTDAELAEAYGKSLTAQAIVARAKERAPDAETWRHFSELLVKLFRIVARIISVAAAVVFGILTAAWLWIVWQLIFGRLHFYDQLRVINGWHEWLTITALYLLPALPVLLIARLFYRIATDRKQTRATTVSESSLAVLWGVAAITLIAFGTAYAQNFRDYANTHKGELRVGSSHVCVDTTKCGNSRDRIYYNAPVPEKPMVPRPLNVPPSAF
jgi:phage shock protein PspC (stress-responsive transcriptional regulator)